MRVAILALLANRVSILILAKIIYKLIDSWSDNTSDGFDHSLEHSFIVSIEADSTDKISLQFYEFQATVILAVDDVNLAFLLMIQVKEVVLLVIIDVNHLKYPALRYIYQMAYLKCRNLSALLL